MSSPKQVFEAVEILVAGFEAAAARDCRGGGRLAPAALEAEGDHFYQGVLSVVLRLVFLLYAEDQALLPVDHPTYAEHLSLFGLHERLAHDAARTPRACTTGSARTGSLLGLFRAVFFGREARHAGAAAAARAAVRPQRLSRSSKAGSRDGPLRWSTRRPERAVTPPSIDDGTMYRVMHRLVVFEGQRLSYRTLDVEQIGSVYESLMGYHVLRLRSPAVRVGKFGVWVAARRRCAR